MAKRATTRRGPQTARGLALARQARRGLTAARRARRLAVALARCCGENRCRDVVVLDLRRLSPVTDFFILATGTSARQMRAVAHHLIEAGQTLGQKLFGIEGLDPRASQRCIGIAETGSWVLVDYVDVVTHIFTEASRRYYDLELLWGDAPRIDWTRGWRPRPESAGPEVGDLG